MKKLIGVFLLGVSMIATASNCDEISRNIGEKIKNNGVDPSHFQLKLESTDTPKEQIEGKIVGSCDHGQQYIVYIRLDKVVAESQVQATNATSETLQQNVDKVTQPSTINPTEQNLEPKPVEEQ
ncbi:hypothetical protein A9G35_07515 [Gilliamella sp. Choc5-1]|jgi:hypothetical protein|uniref:DUF1161 domain-containing protein n=1 Tax=Gilliamella sp. Choc5-1 TaxID=3120238 RepID=UPI00080E049E|nr:DUF1161 domain-containing protein [Gilliamella apicola]OCG44844.1 hypothetical protein A9G35_07515 [Gilliamella apicola]